MINTKPSVMITRKPHPWRKLTFDMLTCNLFEIVHNIWLQQSYNRGTCLFIAMSDDYLQTFKKSSLYYAFLQGGAFGTNLNKNELCLHRAS
jgi:hypothetical protein